MEKLSQSSLMNKQFGYEVPSAKSFALHSEKTRMAQEFTRQMSHESKFRQEKLRKKAMENYRKQEEL